MSLLVETAMGARLRAPFLFPHVGLIIVIYSGLEDGMFTGLRAGLWLGILLDFLALERFGTYTLVYGTAGLLCGLLKGKVFVDSFVSQWLIPTCVYGAVLFAVSLAGRAEPDETVWPLFRGLLWSSSFISTVVFSPLIFRWSAAHLITKRPVQPARFAA